MSKKFKLALILFILGFIGVLSTLALRPMLLEESKSMWSDLPLLWNSKLRYLIFPTINLIVAITVGTLLYDKVNFKLPLLEGLIDKNRKIETSGILLYGIIGGIIAGVLLSIILPLFAPILPHDFFSLKGNIKINILTSLLNGGITTEIINRFGIMTFFVWVIYKILGKLTPSVYWIAIITMILFFGLINLFPVISSIHGTSRVALISYNLLLSAIGVTVYGWLYWKKGLETAMIAHLLASIIITIGGSVFNF